MSHPHLYNIRFGNNRFVFREESVYVCTMSEKVKGLKYLIASVDKLGKLEVITCMLKYVVMKTESDLLTFSSPYPSVSEEKAIWKERGI